MKEEDFRLFLERLALDMYKDKDSVFRTDLEKIEAFYKFIELDNIIKLREKCKIVAQPFNI